MHPPICDVHHGFMVYVLNLGAWKCAHCHPDILSPAHTITGGWEDEEADVNDYHLMQD